MVFLTVFFFFFFGENVLKNEKLLKASIRRMKATFPQNKWNRGIFIR